MSKPTPKGAWYTAAEDNTHVFVTNPKNDFVCLKCGKCRALHKDHGEIQSSETIYEISASEPEPDQI